MNRLKKTSIFILLCFLLSTTSLYARNIKEMSDFRIMGELELREKQGFSEPVVYKTINHQGGMKVRVLEIGKRGIRNDKEGIWLHVITTLPMWVESGEWIKNYTHFWIFLEDEWDIFDYEE